MAHAESGPTTEQLLILVDRAGRGRLRPVEVARLRDGVERLLALEALCARGVLADSRCHSEP